MRFAFITVLLVLSFSTHAETPADFQKQFAAQAQQENPAFTGFSAEQGQRFYANTHGKESVSYTHLTLPTSDLV